MSMVETWRSVYGYTGRYEVSNLGRVRNARTHRVLKGRSNLARSQLEKGQNTTAYLQVGLYGRGGTRKNQYIHILVMRNFVGPRPARRDVAHLDDDPANNRLDNLEYALASRNRGRHKPGCICPWCREADVQCDGDDLYFDYDQATTDWRESLEEAPF